MKTVRPFKRVRYGLRQISRTQGENMDIRPNDRYPPSEGRFLIAVGHKPIAAIPEEI